MTATLIEAIARAIDESIGDHHTSSLMARDVLSAMAAAGYAAVPVTPTPKMAKVGVYVAQTGAVIPAWEAMISAAQGDGA